MAQRTLTGAALLATLPAPGFVRPLFQSVGKGPEPADILPGDAAPRRAPTDASGRAKPRKA